MIEKSQMMPAPEDGKLEQRLLVGVSPSHISEQLVRWTHRFCQRLKLLVGCGLR
jgi:hypothetical protein